MCRTFPEEQFFLSPGVIVKCRQGAVVNTNGREGCFICIYFSDYATTAEVIFLYFADRASRYNF